MKYKYHTSFTCITESGKLSMKSQLYNIGVYVILNGDPSLQFGLSPQKMVAQERELMEDVKAGKVSDLALGPEITVEEINGFWKEVES